VGIVPSLNTLRSL